MLCLLPDPKSSPVMRRSLPLYDLLGTLAALLAVTILAVRNIFPVERTHTTVTTVVNNFSRTEHVRLQ